MEEEHQPAMLSADDIWAAHDIREDVVSVPEWGGNVRIRALTLEQMATLANRATKRQPNGQEAIDRETSVALTLVYGMIEPKLSEKDVPKLLAKSANAVTRIVQAITALGVTDEAVTDAAKSDAAKRNGQIPVLPGAGTGDDTF